MCPTDLSTAEAAGTTKVIGADPATGVEDNYLEVFEDGSVGVRNSWKAAEVTFDESADNTAVLTVDTAGYAIAYAACVGVAGDTGNIIIRFDTSNDLIEWFEVTTVLSSMPVYTQQTINLVAGALDSRAMVKVDCLGRYLRVFCQTHSGGSGTGTVKLYLNASDSNDSLGRANSVFVVDAGGNMLNTDGGELGVNDSLGRFYQGNIDTSTSSIDTKLNTLGQKTMATSAPVVLASDQSALETFPGVSTRVDTFTGTGNGTTVDTGAKGAKVFTLLVKATGVITSWDIRLEGSLDGTNFTTILTHTNVSPGDATSVFSGANISPCRYFRSRCNAVVLGAGTNLVTTIMGMN